MSKNTSGMNRRHFLKSTAVAGAGLALARSATRSTAAPNSDELKIGVIGVGRQGSILLHHMLKMPGIHIQAICDAWSYTSRRGGGMCRVKKIPPNMYTNVDDMLAKEKDMDGVIIAIPDFMHHEATNKCLKAGIHVYCEKEMSNDLEKARSMVTTAKETGKLLQIGHQRRSNPYYLHAYNMIHKDKFFGDLVACRAQWNQKKPVFPTPAKLVSKYGLSKDELAAIGFQNMDEFYNWRWFKNYAGGPMTDLGSHQVDIFEWYLDAAPSSVYAMGDNSFATANAKKLEAGFAPECYDHTFALYEFNAPQGLVRAYYQVDLRTSHGGFYEEFMGKKGSMTIAEIKSKNRFARERTEEQPEWVDEAEMVESADGDSAMSFDPLASRKKKGKMDDEESKRLAAQMEKPAHQPHLENFFDAIRDSKVKLTCPPEIGFKTCVSVLAANESAMAGKKIEFKKEDFIA